MSCERSLARITGPFVQIVPSAIWLASMDGLRSAASSSSTRAESFRCFSSLPTRFCA